MKQILLNSVVDIACEEIKLLRICLEMGISTVAPVLPGRVGSCRAGCQSRLRGPGPEPGGHS